MEDQADVSFYAKNYSKTAAMQMPGLAQAQCAKTQTELASLLHTINSQAYDLRKLAESILERVSPQPEEGNCDAQAFGSGYIGQAEQIRSTLSATSAILLQLSKLA